MTAASNAKWYPEWVIAGDNFIDGRSAGVLEDQGQMANAWITTRWPLLNDNGMADELPCREAIQSVDPNMRTKAYYGDMVNACNNYYDDIRQLFIGIQVAGPKLNPTSMDQGLHAIPAKPSTSPYTPSCYYLPGDYTCVKDAAAMYWDPNAVVAAGQRPGCWRMWEGGKRYLIGGWPKADILDGKTGSEPCNLYDPGEVEYIRTD